MSGAHHRRIVGVHPRRAQPGESAWRSPGSRPDADPARRPPRGAPPPPRGCRTFVHPREDRTGARDIGHRREINTDAHAASSRPAAAPRRASPPDAGAHRRRAARRRARDSAHRAALLIDHDRRAHRPPPAAHRLSRAVNRRNPGAPPPRWAPRYHRTVSPGGCGTSHAGAVVPAKPTTTRWPAAGRASPRALGGRAPRPAAAMRTAATASAPTLRPSPPPRRDRRSSATPS